MGKRVDRVNSTLVDIAISHSVDIHEVYGQCVLACYRRSGKFDIGFNARDLVDWIQINRPGVFDAKGRKVLDE